MARTGYEDTHKARWIRKLLDQGLTPGIIVLTTIDEVNWQEVERKYIAECREQLTNTSAGGDGVDAPRTEQWRAKIGAAHRGKAVSEETRQKLREASLAKHESGCKNGHPWTEESTVIGYKCQQTYRLCRLCRNENARLRRLKKGLKGRAKKFCKLGHPLEGDNLRLLQRRWGVEHICRECVRIRNRKAKKKAKET